MYTRAVHMGIRMAQPWQNPTTGIYYFRQRVPQDVAHFAKGRRVAVMLTGERHEVTLGEALKFSLGTREPKEAKARYPEAAAQAQRIWDSLRAGMAGEPSISSRERDAFAGMYYRDLCEQQGDNPGRAEGWYDALGAMKDLGETPQGLETMHGASLDNLLAQQGLSIWRPEERIETLDALHGAYCQFHRLQQRRAEGDWRPDPQADRFPPMQPSAAKGPKAAISAPPVRAGLRDLFKAWQDSHEAEGKSARTVTDFRGKLESLIAFRKSDSLGSLDQRGIVEWLEHLRDRQELSAKTIADKYLAALKAILSHAKGRFLIDTDPSEGIQWKKTKQPALRGKGFTDSEALAILTAAGNAPPKGTNWQAQRIRATQWGPWLLAYTGARVVEIMQLRTGDIGEEGGIVFLHITPEAGSTKTSEARQVPIHSHLIEKGFLEMVQALPEGPIFTTPSATKAEAHRKAQAMGGRLTEWFWAETGIEDRTLSPNRGWRHRFKTIGRKQDIQAQTLDAIQGHTLAGASGGYGEVDLETKRNAIERFPRYQIKTTRDHD